MKPIKILILEDNPETSILLMNLMDSAGYDVILASEAKDAIRIAIAEQPQLVLLDIMIPEMDGIEVCRALRAHPKTNNIKVIMISCLDDKKEMVAAATAGANDYIVKPFENTRLLGAVKYALEGSSAV